MKADEILKKRRDRAIAIILNAKERDIDPLLRQSSGGPDASRSFRKVILDQLNEFCELALDITGTGTPDYFYNAVVWEQKLDDIHRVVVHPENGDGST